ncbi:MFS transporter [Candidatus Dojkabacteria bacterium]|nr:MFS transporter [Candidatus Dojkabacteria bacterium]
MEEISGSKKVLPGLLYNKSFLSLWCSQILTQVGIGTFAISMAILSDQGVLSAGLKGTASGVGLIVFLSNLPALFLSGIGGVIVDWWDRKKIMIAANLLRFVIMLFFLLFRGWESLTISYIAILLMSVIQQFFIPAEGSTIPNVVSTKSILLANSLFSITLYSTYIFGIGGSGQLLKLLGQQGIFVFLAALFLSGTIVLLFVKIPPLVDRIKPDISNLWKLVTGIFGSWKQGLNYIKNNRVMKYTLLHIFIVQVAVLTSVTVVFRIGRELFGIDSHNIGSIIIVPAAIGVFLGFIVMNTFGKNRRKFLIINEGVFVIGIGCLMLTALAIFKEFAHIKIPSSLEISMISVVLIAFGAPFLIIPAQALIHEKTEESFRGRVYSVWMAINQTLASIPAFLFGLLMDKVVNLYGFMILATVSVLSYAGVLSLMRHKLDTK